MTSFPLLPPSRADGGAQCRRVNPLACSTSGISHHRLMSDIFWFCRGGGMPRDVRAPCRASKGSANINIWDKGLLPMVGSLLLPPQTEDVGG